MSDKDKEAYREWWSKAILTEGRLTSKKAWQAACEYKQKECSNIMDAMTRTSQNNAKLQAEKDEINKKLQRTKDFLNQLLSYASDNEDEVFTNKYTLLAFKEELSKK